MGCRRLLLQATNLLDDFLLQGLLACQARLYQQGRQ